MSGYGSSGSQKLMTDDFNLSAILWEIDIDSDHFRGDSDLTLKSSDKRLINLYQTCFTLCQWNYSLFSMSSCQRVCMSAF